jgi:hypothetical protein
MEAPRTAASTSKKSSIVPWLLGGAAILGLIVLWERRAKASTKTTTGGQDLTPINYVPPISDIDRADQTQQTNTKQLYEIMLVGDASDAGPLMLAKAWTGDATQARLAELEAANPDALKRVEVTPVVFVDNETGVAMPATIQRVVLPAGQMVDAQVNASTGESNNYPGRPSGTTSGAWRPAGSSEPSLTPWIVGQTVKIPEAWGAPPAALASRASAIQTSV